jgi:hypothetical protein
MRYRQLRLRRPNSLRRYETFYTSGGAMRLTRCESDGYWTRDCLPSSTILRYASVHEGGSTVS